MKTQLDTPNSQRADGSTTVTKKLGNSLFLKMLSVMMALMGFLLPELRAQDTITIDGSPADWPKFLQDKNLVSKKLPDIYNPDDIWFQGTKDILPIGKWTWAYGNANDKGNIINAGFVLVDKPHGRHLFFFADRFDNSGDEAIGFWFLQDRVSQNPLPAGSRSSDFSGEHVDGDILVVSHFENGGTGVTHPKVFKWQLGANKYNLVELTPVGDDLTAASNQEVMDVPTLTDPDLTPWLYTAKNGVAQKYPVNTFWEGVINLDVFGMGEISRCYATVVVETRMSQSEDASLEDVLLGNMGVVPLKLPLTGSAECFGASDAGTVTLENSELGTTYQLYKEMGTTDEPVGTSMPGTGTTITWNGLTNGSTYYAIATNILTMCTETLDPVNVVINPPPTCTITGEASVPESSTENLYKASAASIYSWSISGKGTIVGPTNEQTVSVTAGVAPGSFTVTVTITDANGCQSTCSKTVTLLNKPVAVPLDGDEYCAGDPNKGTVSSTLKAEANTSYQLWKAGTPDVAIGSPITTEGADLVWTKLDPGEYYVIATSDLVTYSATPNPTVVENPNPEASAVATPADCFGTATGKVDLTVTGGTAGYTYLWSNKETTEDISGLLKGTYSVTVTDSKGCTATAEATVDEPPALTCTAAQVSPVKCFGESNGSATVTPVGGNGGYTYLWDNGETTATATKLNAGKHSVTVTDSKGCTTSCEVTIDQPPVLTCTAAQVSPVKCFGESNGSATITPVGGNGGYTYLWDNGETTATATKLNAGKHSVTVTDSKGCTTSCEVTIDQPPVLTCTAAQVSPVKCFGESNGSATVTPVGGNGGYTYLWDNGETTATATKLNAGKHSVTVTDSKGCTTSCEVTIDQPPVLTCTAAQVSPVKCFGESNGSATVTPVGGNGGYTYLWDNGETTATATKLNAGKHSVTVTDSKGCTTSCEVTIDQPPVLTCTAAQVSPVKCFGESNGSATVTPVGGNGGYTYLWDNGETTATATKLNAGKHSVTVTDSKGCTTSCEVTIDQPPVLTCSVSGLTEVCNSSMNPYSGPEGMKTYKWTITGNGTIYGADNARTVQVISSAIGTYTLTLVTTNQNDCEATCSTIVKVIGCAPICTYTQGYYGNAGGMSCFEEPPLNTTQQALLKAIAKPDPINGGTGGVATFGIESRNQYFKLFTSDINGNTVLKDNNIFRMLPGGGKAAAIKEYTSGIVKYDNSLSWIAVPLDTKKSTEGKIRNGLLAQTMTLYFNLQNSTNLAGLEIKAYGFITQQVDCSTKVAMDMPQTFMLPAAVVDYLNAGHADYPNTVFGLYKLANAYLGGLTPGGLDPESVAGAVDKINNAFDECRIITGYEGELPTVAPITRVTTDAPAANANASNAAVKGLKVSAYPNPFVDRVKFVISSEVSGNAQMEILDVRGRVIARPYNGYIYAGRSQTVEVMLRNASSEQLIYRLRVGNNTASGKLMRVSE